MSIVIFENEEAADAEFEPCGTCGGEGWVLLGFCPRPVPAGECCGGCVGPCFDCSELEADPP